MSDSIDIQTVFAEWAYTLLGGIVVQQGKTFLSDNQFKEHGYYTNINIKPWDNATKILNPVKESKGIRLATRYVGAVVSTVVRGKEAWRKAHILKRSLDTLSVESFFKAHRVAINSIGNVVSLPQFHNSTVEQAANLEVWCSWRQEVREDVENTGDIEIIKIKGNER